MKNLIIFTMLALGGCATISKSDTEYYHRFAAKPTITEQDLGNGRRREILSNPFDVKIVVDVDCDNEMVKRKLTVKSSGNVSFETISDVSHACSPVSWAVKAF